MEQIHLLNSKGFSSISELPMEKLEEIRKLANDSYHNNVSLISDSLYDSLVDLLESRSGGPIGTIGSVVADKDERKTTLPFPMASMNKIKTPEAIARFISNNPSTTFNVTDKLDGISLLYDTQTSPSKIHLYTRGNGTVGLDVSHITEFIQSIPHVENIVVRGELIMSKRSLDSYVASGNRRVPARNIVSGTVGSKTLDDEWKKTANQLDFVVYQLIEPRLSYSDGLKFLQEKGFNVVSNIKMSVSKVNFKNLSEILNLRRNKSPQEIDGIIVRVSSAVSIPSIDNPKDAMAFKTVDTDTIKEAVVDHIFWRETSQGRLTPTVILVGEGVNIAGVNIKRVSAHNSKFVVDNKLGPGAVVQMIRGGDVIPHIHKVVSGSSSGEVQMPEVEYEWKGVDVFTVRAGDGRCKDVLMKCFRGIGVKGVGPGKVEILQENGQTKLLDFLEMDPKDLADVKGMSGKTGEMIKSELERCLNSCKLVDLMVASGCFGEGLGVRKITPILNAFPPAVRNPEFPDFPTDLPIEFPNIDEDTISTNVSGISSKSALQYIEGIEKFYDFIRDNNLQSFDVFKLSPIEPINLVIRNNENEIGNRNKLNGKIMVFTGGKMKEAIDLWEANGGEIGSSITSKTVVLVCKDPTANTTKTQTAIKKGIHIIGHHEVLDFIQSLLK